MREHRARVEAALATLTTGSPRAVTPSRSSMWTPSGRASQALPPVSSPGTGRRLSSSPTSTAPAVSSSGPHHPVSSSLGLHSPGSLASAGLSGALSEVSSVSPSACSDVSSSAAVLEPATNSRPGDLGAEAEPIFDLTRGQGSPTPLEALRSFLTTYLPRLGVGPRQASLRAIVDLAMDSVAFLPRLEMFLFDLLPPQPVRAGGPPRRQPTMRITRRMHRRMEFARTQDLYRRNRRACARLVLDGPPKEPPGDPVDFLDFWTSIMVPGEPDFSEPLETAPQAVAPEVLEPFSEDEVRAAFPDGNSAPGPDGVTSSQLKAVPVPYLVIIINLFLLAGDVPLICTKHGPSSFQKCPILLVPEITGPSPSRLYYYAFATEPWLTA
ncbi:uncharacterized protein LOC135375881 [Ornithodoros turicata]|uniref:uncharacterized protein LOC135375881 n=1 Tax=Ornithodoros turicata TaxID=34597 RepID=UPI0031386483